ncbi:thiol reductant ABC exporter subunit CydD [Leifsonia sp. PS1209]|uniref:thiol reductant ABC exporter subunit CydD n=1 Tax=Leifsonia sp. PS1209 TaxID=2724914 RepID=UPI001442A510|nr:thiol reductant ABC exporter subunit CydD [Leifsonia sp. PS1209]QIZ98693.1 thiol reductant ABC exporter subunit CydD [Leifsonia sp. PS1209]
MRPLDPRLLRYAAAARTTLAVGGVLAVAQTACVVLFAWLVTQLVVRGVAGEQPAALAGLLGWLALVVLVRGAVGWLAESAAARGGATVVGQLRSALVAAIGRLGPGWLRTRSTADVTVTVGRGLDALDGYFTKYVPQLILTAIATPILVLVIFWQDPTSGLIVVITLPLIPVFMMLVGWATQAAQSKQWSALSRLSRGFLDVVDGLSTLKLFGRQHRQEARIRSVSDDYRVHTMKVLRMSFLSGFVLELAASLSVALVAVAIGLRLLNGQLDLSVGLFVLLLAPEAFLPLRNVGASFHAATEGIEAAQAAFAVLDEDRAAAGAAAGAASSSGQPGLVFDDVTISYDDREVVTGFSADIPPGTLAVLTAPSGSGKSSLLAAVLGFVPFTGTISAGGAVDAAGRRDAVAWAAQTPGLIAGTIASNVTLGSAHPEPALVAEALRLAAADELAPETMLGVGGAGLSGGQAQRVAVARALYRLRASGASVASGGTVLLLDEPTSALDETAEARLLGTLRRIADDGVAVLVVSHRDQVADAADLVLRMEAGSRVE